MYYGLLIIAVFLIAAQFSFMTAYQRKVGKTVFLSLIFIAIASITGSIIFICINGFKLQINVFTVICSLLYCCIYIGTLVLGIKALSLGNMAIYSMFMMMGGMLLPFLYGVTFLNESLSALKIAGIIVLIAALILTALNGTKQKMSLKFILVCISIFLINGSVGILTKFYSNSPSSLPVINYAALSYIFSAALSSILALTVFLTYRKQPEKCAVIKTSFTAALKKSYFVVAFSVVCSVAYLLQLISVSHLPASVQFPILSGGVMALSAICGLLFFHEKLRITTIISVILAFAATILFVF